MGADTLRLLASLWRDEGWTAAAADPKGRAGNLTARRLSHDGGRPDCAAGKARLRRCLHGIQMASSGCLARAPKEHSGPNAGEGRSTKDAGRAVQQGFGATRTHLIKAQSALQHVWTERFRRSRPKNALYPPCAPYFEALADDGEVGRDPLAWRGADPIPNIEQKAPDRGSSGPATVDGLQR